MFNIHNDREYELVQSLLLECKYCIYYKFHNIEKINGLTNALYMLEIIDKPLKIINYDDVYNLLNLINNGKWGKENE